MFSCLRHTHRNVGRQSIADQGKSAWFDSNRDRQDVLDSAVGWRLVVKQVASQPFQWEWTFRKRWKGVKDACSVMCCYSCAYFCLRWEVHIHS